MNQVLEGLRVVGLVAVALSPTLGCEDPGEPGHCPEVPCYADPASCLTASTAHGRYVVDSIRVPSTATEAQQLGLDIDGDPNGRPDNSLGQLVSSIAQGFDADLQALMDETIARGDIVVLVDIEAAAERDRDGVALRWFAASDAMPTPCDGDSDPVCGRHLDGNGSFIVDASEGLDQLLPGSIAAGEYVGGPGRAFVYLRLSETHDPFRLPLIGARVQVTIDNDGLMEGRLAGAVPAAEVQRLIPPAFEDAFMDSIARVCSGESPDCCPGLRGGLFFGDDGCPELFDEQCFPSRSALSMCLERAGLLASLLSPFVDLVDADDHFAPNCDGEPDGVSVGIGFSARTAQFTLP